MPRTKGHVAHKKKVRRILKAAKGYDGARSKLLGPARDTVLRAGVYSYRDRRARKRDFRSLWITRITAACRSRGISRYGLKIGVARAIVSPLRSIRFSNSDLKT